MNGPGQARTHLSLKPIQGSRSPTTAIAASIGLALSVTAQAQQEQQEAIVTGDKLVVVALAHSGSDRHSGFAQRRQE